MFDCAKLTIIKTIDASNLIYKIVAINDDHLLCGGNKILMVLRVSDFTVIVKEDTQSVIWDIVRVNKENEFALTTITGIEFIKIEAATLAIQRLPLKLNNTLSSINKIRDNLLLISDGKDLLFTYGTLNENKLSQCNNSSHVWSIKRLEQNDN